MRWIFHENDRGVSQRLRTNLLHGLYAYLSYAMTSLIKISVNPSALKMKSQSKIDTYMGTLDS